jgi:hypothetical protein
VKSKANFDDFVKRPISALRFISLSLRRTVSTPRATRFARLDLGLFTKSSKWMTYYEPINFWKIKLPAAEADGNLIFAFKRAEVMKAIAGRSALT